jgi:hypothetical protein
MTTFPRSRFAAGLLLLLLSSGCGSGDSRVRVSGKVSFQGQPVGEQTLVLVSEGAPGEFFTQPIPLQADGSFSGEVPVRGTYKVVIEESRAVQEGEKPADPSKKIIPVKYRNRDTSDLSWDIQKSNNYQEFELKE